MPNMDRIEILEAQLEQYTLDHSQSVTPFEFNEVDCKATEIDTLKTTLRGLSEYFITPKGSERLKVEIEALEAKYREIGYERPLAEVGSQENRDLKDEMQRIQDEIAEKNRILREAIAVTPIKHRGIMALFGSHLTIELLETGKVRKISLVGHGELHDESEGLMPVSIVSPAGRKFYLARPDEEIQIEQDDRTIRYRIKHIESPADGVSIDQIRQLPQLPTPPDTHKGAIKKPAYSIAPINRGGGLRIDGSSEKPPDDSAGTEADLSTRLKIALMVREVSGLWRLFLTVNLNGATTNNVEAFLNNSELERVDADELCFNVPVASGLIIVRADRLESTLDLNMGRTLIFRLHKERNSGTLVHGHMDH